MNKTDRKKWMTLAVMILLIFTCSGCGTRHPKMKEALRVGVVTYTLDDPFINAMTGQAERKLKIHGNRRYENYCVCKKWQG